MNRLLRIADLSGGIFLDMPAVLTPLRPDAEALHWSILDLGDVVATEESGVDVLELERTVFSSPTGLSMSFRELWSFASNTGQVIDGLFVAYPEGAEPPQRTDDDRAVVGGSEMVVAAFDSTFWLVSAPDRVLSRVEESFRDVTEEDPGSTPLRAWGN